MVNFSILTAFSGAAVIVIMTLVILSKAAKIKFLRDSVDKLKKALDEMDEQAKLIVRTDIELNKAQEDLDRKVTGLYTLQKLSRSISSTLEESQVFKRIEPVYLADLGFQKALIFLFDEKKEEFFLKMNLGYEGENLLKIKEFIEANKETYFKLINSEKASSSIMTKESPVFTPLEKAAGKVGGGKERSSLTGFTNKIKEIFGVVSFISTPILVKEGNQGILFVGTEKIDTSITEGDEDLITILSSQIGQALENAGLFEKTWQAHQDLEKRVEERTQELSKALEEVKEMSLRKNEFVSNVSHELRTPLTSIKGYASILLSGKLGTLPEEAGKRLEKINKHSDELVQIINDLLDLARIESGKVELRLELINLKNLVEEVADLLAMQFRDKQIEFSLDAPDDIPAIAADYNQLKRVFINLINNAVKYTSQGRISVRLIKLEKEIQINVQDTGCGIPESALDKLFTEFYRVDSSMNQEIKGTGLGLALVKSIISAHKGRIWVQSKEGAGTIFSFIFPQAGLPETGGDIGSGNRNLEIRK